MARVFTPDFNEGPRVVPGLYQAKILTCEQRPNKSGEGFHLNWKFEINHPDPKFNRQWVYCRTALSGKGAQKFKQIVKAAYLPEYENGPIDIDLLIGREVAIQVDHQINQDGTPGPYLEVTEISATEEAFDSYESNFGSA